MFQEPDIATYLIDRGIMTRQNCVNFGKKITHFTWQVQKINPYFAVMLYYAIKSIMDNTVDTTYACF